MQEALKGINVLDLTSNLPGPYMTWLMAEMGAEILKVEPPETGDPARGYTNPENENFFPVFDVINRGKKSITLDLKQSAGRAVFQKLIHEYNIVVEGFRPGILKKLGIDYETVKQKHPQIIYVSITGYGQTGLYSQRGGHDLNFQALAGSFDTGSSTLSPHVPNIPIADLSGGLFALSGLLAAILSRNTTGKGCHIDMSMLDSAVALNIFAFCQAKRNKFRKSEDPHILSGSQPFYNLYQTLDNQYMSLAALEQKFWVNFCRSIDREDLIAAQYGGDQTIKEVARIFRSKTQTEWINHFKVIDACCEPVLEFGEVTNSNTNRERNLMSRDHEMVFNSPIKAIGNPPEKQVSPPSPGQHNREILERIS